MLVFVFGTFKCVWQHTTKGPAARLLDGVESDRRAGDVGDGLVWQTFSRRHEGFFKNYLVKQTCTVSVPLSISKVTCKENQNDKLANLMAALQQHVAFKVLLSKVTQSLSSTPSFIHTLISRGIFPQVSRRANVVCGLPLNLTGRALGVVVLLPLGYKFLAYFIIFSHLQHICANIIAYSFA